MAIDLRCHSPQPLIISFVDFKSIEMEENNMTTIFNSDDDKSFSKSPIQCPTPIKFNSAKRRSSEESPSVDPKRRRRMIVQLVEGSELSQAQEFEFVDFDMIDVSFGEDYDSLPELPK
jgi:hypothetical protein